MKWLNKLKEYAPDIASAVLTGGATLPALAMKAVAEATGASIGSLEDMGQVIESADPTVMLKITQANNNFKIRMAELGNELTATELGDVQHAREIHKHSIMPAVICVFLSISVVGFGAALMLVVIPEQNTRIIDTLFGSILTAWFGSINYWVSSTRSSADKNKMLGTRGRP